VSILSQDQIRELADRLDSARLESRCIPKITDSYPDMDVEAAYGVQREIRDRRQASGETLIGYKVGLTSWAKMKQLGIDTPAYGFLMDSFQFPNDGTAPMRHFIQPKVEPEIAFVTARELMGPNCDATRVLEAIAGMMPAIEIVDSRYENFRFDLVSLIADNVSSCAFVTGSMVSSIERLDLCNLAVTLEINGRLVETGTGKAVLDHPANSVAQLVNMLAKHGESLPAGSVVLSGAVTAAPSVQAGDTVSVHAEDLGSVSIHFTG
jgi:2-oxo-3-hexenedioate decarboxylase